MALALSACGDGVDGSGAEPAVVARTNAVDVPIWLSQTEAMDPARWIASREAGTLLPEADPRSARLRASLARARSAFIEDPRMIANRTVQLGQMLAAAEMPQDYADLVDGFSGIAGASHRRQLYGEMCQHYFNTRQQGLDAPTALARLTESYGAQGGAARAEPAGSPQ
ncbi:MULTISPECIES: hypothetical protein [Methylobacterium]|uniref:hypothetical protein n=1 Tax=Methylobacterium TaxID=407 RepID=UPI001EE1F788|nr:MULTISPECIES: hypothetical protein [Methylobacterium]